MLQFLHAGIIAACRQVVALLVFALILLLIAPITEGFWLVAGPPITWGYLLVAGGLALTAGKSIDQTANRIRRVSSLMRKASRNAVAMALVSQFGLAAVLLAVLALRTPPHAMIVIAEYLGYDLAASIMWAAVLSVGVACLGATAHAAVKAIEFDYSHQ